MHSSSLFMVESLVENSSAVERFLILHLLMRSVQWELSICLPLFNRAALQDRFLYDTPPRVGFRMQRNIEIGHNMEFI